MVSWYKGRLLNKLGRIKGVINNKPSKTDLDSFSRTYYSRLKQHKDTDEYQRVINQLYVDNTRTRQIHKVGHKLIDSALLLPSQRQVEASSGLMR